MGDSSLLSVDSIEDSEELEGLYESSPRSFERRSNFDINRFLDAAQLLKVPEPFEAHGRNAVSWPTHFMIRSWSA
jgi:hypothetical protein